MTAIVKGSDFDGFRVDTLRALERYKTWFKYCADWQNSNIPAVSFGVVSEFRRIPERGYSARAEVPVLVDDLVVGLMYAVVFAPGDGTGDNSMGWKFHVSQRLLFEEKQSRVFPRSKDRCLIEACFPLFSHSTTTGTTSLNTVSLEQLTTEGERIDGQVGNGIITDCFLGSSPEAYARELLREQRPLSEMSVPLTCGYRRTGERVGDPHAVWAPDGRSGSAQSVVYSNVIQVVGFVAVEKKSDGENPLARVFDDVGRVPVREKRSSSDLHIKKYD